jgi:hypothetical protein
VKDALVDMLAETTTNKTLKINDLQKITTSQVYNFNNVFQQQKNEKHGQEIIFTPICSVF